MSYVNTVTSTKTVEGEVQTTVYDIEAKKLYTETEDVGSDSQPVYFHNGLPVACTNAGGGGGGTSVEIDPILTSGVEIATFKIGSDPTQKLYAPQYSNLYKKTQLWQGALSVVGHNGTLGAPFTSYQYLYIYGHDTANNFGEVVDIVDTTMLNSDLSSGKAFVTCSHFSTAYITIKFTSTVAFQVTATSALPNDTNPSFNYVIDKIYGVTFGLSEGGGGGGGDYVTAGQVAGEEIGERATAEGYYVVAKGDYSHAEGLGTTAAIAMSSAGPVQGYNRAVGNASHAEGYITSATGDYSHAEGTNVMAIGMGSHAEGGTTWEHNFGSFGYTTIAYGIFSHSEGYGTAAYGSFCHSEGWQTQAGSKSYSYPKDSYDYLGCHAEGYSCVADSGNGAHAEGETTAAMGGGCHSEGSNTAAIGPCCHAEGFRTSAINMCAHAEGGWTWSIDDRYGVGYTHAEGMNTSADASYAHSEGCYTLAYERYSHSEGYYTTAWGNGSHVQGQYTQIYNDGGFSTGIANRARMNYESGGGTMLAVGNGSYTGSGSSAVISRSNAFAVEYDGTTKAAGTITASTNADYAEYFEWADNNNNNEDRVGLFVTFDTGKKIRIANSNDRYILGIVAGSPFVLGNGDCDSWNKMYLRDDFGRKIMQNIQEFNTNSETGEQEPKLDENGNFIYRKTMVLNPEYDDSQKYIPRRDRAEWDAIGMLGVLTVKDDGTCQVDDYCTVGANGFATAADENAKNVYRVVGRKTPNIIEVVFR